MSLTSVRRLCQCHFLFAVVLTISPHAMALAAEPAVASLQGSVKDEDGQPLAGVRVRVAVPATDMRFFDSNSTDKPLQALTDDQGKYVVEIPVKPIESLTEGLSAQLGNMLGVEIPGLSAGNQVSVDAMKPGFRRRSGMLMTWDGETKVKMIAGRTTSADMVLKRSGYFAGTVVDEDGLPIAGVAISANASGENFSAGVERTSTDESGNFELFNYPETRADLGDRFTDCRVSFFHPDYVSYDSRDVYEIEQDQRTKMRVILPTGYQITGAVKSVSGKPFGGAMVKVASMGGIHRKAMVTDEQGKFTIRGIHGSEIELSCIDRKTNQKRKLQLTLDANMDDLQVQLLPISVSTLLKTYDVLGIKLTDITPELKAAYELSADKGAMIVEPGLNHARLDIGDLAKGDCFWMAGNDRIGNVCEFVAKVLEEAAKPQSLFRVRVVYSLSRPNMDGTNTQYLMLTPEDIEQLQGVLDQINELETTVGK